MRTFIAVELNPEVKKALAKLQEELKITQADVKWVKPQNIHLTLKFLGEVDENKIPKITQAIKEMASQRGPFYIKLAGLGAFPNLKFPRVIWVGLKEGQEKLIALTDTLTGLLLKLKFAKEKRGYSGHLTLGRVKSRKNIESLSQKLGELKVPELRQAINSIALFKSILEPGGPIYEKLAEESLKNN